MSTNAADRRRHVDDIDSPAHGRVAGRLVVQRGAQARDECASRSAPRPATGVSPASSRSVIPARTRATSRDRVDQGGRDGHPGNRPGSPQPRPREDAARPDLERRGTAATDRYGSSSKAAGHRPSRANASSSARPGRRCHPAEHDLAVPGSIAESPSAALSTAASPVTSRVSSGRSAARRSRRGSAGSPSARRRKIDAGSLLTPDGRRTRSGRT
jgi:hypothetical protein